MNNTSPTLYRKPKSPGYLGTYNWSAMLLGLMALIVTNIITTQHIASHFDFQQAPVQVVPMDRQVRRLFRPACTTAAVDFHAHCSSGLFGHTVSRRRAQHSSQQETHRGD